LISPALRDRVRDIFYSLAHLALQQNIKQLLDEVEQNIVICQWRADQLFADTEGRGK